jgi:hypothetical protein
MVCLGSLCKKCDPLAQPPQCPAPTRCLVRTAGDTLGTCR